jgi:hypothetical protein
MEDSDIEETKMPKKVEKSKIDIDQYYLEDISLQSDVLGYFMPNAILCQIFTSLLSLEDICRFD